MATLSIVVPVFGCVDCLDTLYRRLQALHDLCDELEIVFVDDRSEDGAWERLRTMARGDPCVRAVRLSRNFGQSAAITAGIARASGDVVILMDCDLQDSPEDVPQLLTKALEGYDVVFSRRAARSQPVLRRVAARAYFRIRNRLLGLDIDPDLGSLMLMRRAVADAFLTIRDRDRHHALLLHWLGFRRAYVDLPHNPRHAGRSSYTLRKLLASAVDGMFFQTSVLLRWIVYLGFTVVGMGAASMVFLVAFYFLVQPAPGWTSLVVLLLFIGGFIILSLGISALYIGKVFEQVKDRPLFIVDEEVTATPVTRRGPAADPDAHPPTVAERR